MEQNETYSPPPAPTTQARDLVTFYNANVHFAAEEVLHLVLNAESESVRLKACQDMLDRSPEAPKAIKYEQSASEKRLIQLGVAAVDAMKEALTETGRGEIVELIEGRDWQREEVPQEKPAMPVTESPAVSRVIVREVI